MVANEGPYTFDVPLLGAGFNLTMTTAPEMPVGSNRIKLNIDGLFTEPKSK